MKNLGYLLFLVLLFNSGVNAQVDTNFVIVKPSKRNSDRPSSAFDKNSIYFELLGSTYGIGVSYERKIVSAPDVTLNARIGVGSLLIINAAPTIGFNALIGDKKSFLEIGFNAARTYALELFSGGANTYWVGNPILGYRLITNEGLIFRITFSPFINAFNADIGGDFIPFGGLSIGKTF